MQPPVVTNHAIERWQQRVDHHASTRSAYLAIERMLRAGRWRATPRHWMSETRPAPGTMFVYWDRCPGIAVIVIDGVAVTVLTRDLCRRRREPRLSCARPRRHRIRLGSAESWRWDGARDVEEMA